MSQNLDQWQMAIDENENYIKLGRAMQQRGTVILNSVPIDGAQIDFARVDATGLAKLIDSATKAIERGASLEHTGRANLMKLYQCKPVEFN
jgi:ABC-type transporter Mla MlaB component